MNLSRLKPTPWPSVPLAFAESLEQTAEIPPLPNT